MSASNRAQRIEILSDAARRKSEAKAKDAEDAVRTLVKNGHAVTFQAVQREAGVSHSFLYSHPRLRQRIEHLRSQHRPKQRDPAPDSHSNVVLALTAEISSLKKRLREETSELRKALEQAHGENLELRRELDRRGAEFTSDHL